ncbi:uncharacterized protein EHS24_001056 [Apiotrichum porosum]|uniref:Signal peptidase subunit 3 n=1 Tax=Apiotrichum porosum TaxID=105984 RepID=A0A427YBI0_9TREE|nr:uncharacterized protein EHS24_001056 [Apiotrichum porosum]RSH88511.1 hypothetical protein EHS24_001056 [Apiotrichum porosum]
MQRWKARDEDIARLRFDVKTDLTPLLTSYNTKQLFLYLTAEYTDEATHEAHEVVLWDRIIMRGQVNDFRAVGVPNGAPRTTRPRIRIDDAKSVYTWRNPGGSFQDVHEANVTLHYSLMPYVGMLSSGVAATARDLVEIPDVKRR